jgi:hypothetical protein
MEKQITNAETLAFGARLRESLANAFSQSSPEVQNFVQSLIAQQKAADLRMAAAIQSAGGSHSSQLLPADSVSNPTDQARKLLTAFYRHLWALRHRRVWHGEFTQYFPSGLAAIHESDQAILPAVRTVIQALREDVTLKDHLRYWRRFLAAERRLTQRNGYASDTMSLVAAELSEQSDEKKAWLRCYLGICSIVQGLLITEGRAGLFPALIPHLSSSFSSRRHSKPALAPCAA